MQNKEISFEVLKPDFKDKRFYNYIHSQKDCWLPVKFPLEKIKSICVEGGNCTTKDFLANERVIYLVIDNCSPFILNKKDYIITQINKTEYKVELKKLPKINTLFSVSWEEV